MTRPSGRLAAALLVVSAAGAPARGATPAEGAKAVLRAHCYRCHGRDGRNEGGLNVVTDLKKLVESRRVVPGDPGRSKLLQRVVSGDMPPEFDSEDTADDPKPLGRPTPQDIATLRAWVKAGAPDLPSGAAERKFVSDLDVWKAILDDLRKVPTRDQKFARYFTLTHLANAGYNDDQLLTYRHGLSKLVNSLSWSRRVKAPAAVDPARTVFRVDLRDYLWDGSTWQAVIALYPYGLKPDTTTAATVCRMTGSDLPAVRADWFVYAASRPPLYHAVLKLPAGVADLEKKLDVDVAADVRQDRAVRAAFNASGVSRNNRLIERHESSNGGYWRSYDFAGNADRRNLFSHPLGPGDGEHDFEYDGGEVIFALPNGLNGYMLIDARGARIDKGPTAIVRDNKQADGAVVNGISCMSCHNRGLIEKADQVRDVVAKTGTFDKEVVESINALYPPRERLEELFKEDLERFARAVKLTGAAMSRTEPVFVLATQFEEEVGLKLAAAEAGLKVEEFRGLLAKSPRLGRALGLLLAGGTVKRDAFVAAFPQIAEAMHVSLIGGVPGVTAAPAVADVTPAPAPRGVPQRGEAPPGPQRGQGVPRPGASPFGTRAARSVPRFGGDTPGARGGRAVARPKAAGSRGAIDPDRLAELPASFFGGDNDRFRDVGPTGALLVGVRVSYKDFLGGPKISSVVPLYRSGGGLTEGELHGTVNSAETTAVARPGYAVGGFRTHAGLGVDGFEIVFMKVKGDRLDPSDAYTSPWLGDVHGGSPRDVINPGNLPVGLQGRASGTVRALGLILLK